MNEIELIPHITRAHNCMSFGCTRSLIKESMGTGKGERDANYYIKAGFKSPGIHQKQNMYAHVQYMTCIMLESDYQT